MTVPILGNPVVVGGIPRFVDPDNYAISFGFQWIRFAQTQIDREGANASASEARLWATTGWTPESLAGLNILEAGSGAGRFSRPILERTSANLYSIDFSSAVEANARTNGSIAPDRFHLAQASITDLPYPDNSFDRTLCLGVLQHTPDFEASVQALVAKTRSGGEIVVDFYPVRGWWTWLHAKYLLRPWTKRMDHDRLLSLIERHAARLIATWRGLDRVGLTALTRFLPLVDLRTFPATLDEPQIREWAILDTFDMFSPQHDHPQRPQAVADMFRRAGADVLFAGYRDVCGNSTAIVKGVKQ